MLKIAFHTAAGGALMGTSRMNWKPSGLSLSILRGLAMGFFPWLRAPRHSLLDGEALPSRGTPRDLGVSNRSTPRSLAVPLRMTALRGNLRSLNAARCLFPSLFLELKH